MKQVMVRAWAEAKRAKQFGFVVIQKINDKATLKVKRGALVWVAAA